VAPRRRARSTRLLRTSTCVVRPGRPLRRRIRRDRRGARARDRGASHFVFPL